VVNLLRLSIYKGGQSTKVVNLQTWSIYKGGQSTKMVNLQRWSIANLQRWVTNHKNSPINIT